MSAERDKITIGVATNRTCRQSLAPFRWMAIEALFGGERREASGGRGEALMEAAKPQSHIEIHPLALVARRFVCLVAI